MTEFCNICGDAKATHITPWDAMEYCQPCFISAGEEYIECLEDDIANVRKQIEDVANEI